VSFDGVRLFPALSARMRDGATLVADVWRPEGEGPWPVLLMRQPYGRDIASTVVYAPPLWFARQGFLVVIQDVRGRGDSEGCFTPFLQELEDGEDTLEWAAQLPGSNGRVGMYGFSYQGSTQLYAALSGHPALRAIAPHMTAFDLHSGWFYRDGILQLASTLGWANQMLREDVRRAGPASLYEALERSYLNTGQLSSQMPVLECDPLCSEDAPSYARQWLNQDPGDTYWRATDLAQRASSLRLPMFHLAGWYDFYARGSIHGYRTAAASTPNQVLLAAPWVHIPWGPQTSGGSLGPSSAPDIDERLVRWFHHWLDSDIPASAKSPLEECRYYILGPTGGDGQWATSTGWPPPESVWQDWHLCSRGRANSRFGDGILSRALSDGPPDTFNYDPEVPVTAPGGNLGGSVGWGPFDLAPQQQGNNLLVYTSERLTRPLIVAGSPAVTLHVSTSAPQTDFVVRLSRVEPSGRSTFLALGASRFRAPGPNVTGRLRLHLDSTAVRFAEGDAVRLDVASSAFPLLIRNPNTGADPARVRSPAEFRRATQTVHHTTGRPSTLHLPTLPD
jgi:putative CocE/NonD family hydrolase